MRKCYEQDVVAPRPGCRCEPCYRERERNLDPDLVAMSRGTSFMSATKPSQHVVHRVLGLYLMGKIEWASLHMTIIKALAEQNDQMFADRLKLAMIVPSPMFVQKQD